MSDEFRYDVDLQRFGALGIEEHAEALRDLDRTAVEQFVGLQLDTMTPLDTARIEILRRGVGGERWVRPL